jgi:Fe-S oxidoreductase
MHNLQRVPTLMNSSVNGRIEKNDRCCGESGTLAIARPDVSTQVRFRKEQEMRAGTEKLRADGFDGEAKALILCPFNAVGSERVLIDTRALVRVPMSNPSAPEPGRGSARP